jgi:hypothetical protein
MCPPSSVRFSSTEVLVTFQESFFRRFAALEEQTAGDRVFGIPEWRDVANRLTPEKTPFLLTMYRERLRKAGFPFILTFEMVGDGGQKLYLFFGTTNTVAVERFKDALWAVDGLAGQRFRDPRDVNQMAFDVSAPDFTALDREILRVVGEKESIDLESLKNHVLLETIYRPAHGAAPVKELVDGRRLVPVSKGRKHAECVYALAPPSLL